MSQDTEMQQLGQNKNLIFGVIMIIVGGIFLLDRMDYLDVSELWHYWPAFIALSGAIKILSAKHASHIVHGCVEIFIAFWLYASIEHLWGWSFHTSWPILLIALGISTIARGFFKSDK